MQALTRSLIVAAWLVSARGARAQVPEVTHSCVENCGGGSSSSSADDARRQEALRQEKADEIRIDAENAARASKEARIHTIRRSNETGVKAFQAKQWGLAAAYFQAALAVDPNDMVARRNLDETNRQIELARAHRQELIAQRQRDAALAEARRQLAAEQLALAKRLAKHVDVPPPGQGGVQVGTALPRELPPVMPDAQAYLATAIRQKILATANDAVERGKEWLGMMSPEWQFLHTEANVMRLGTDTVPELITRAAQPGAVPEPVFGLGAATVVMNSGSEPGEAAEKIVKVGSAQVWVLDEAKQQADKLLDGITSLAIGADAHAALKAAQQLPLVQRWTQPAGTTP